MCVKYFLSFALSLFLLYSLFSHFASLKLVTAFPTIDGILSYSDALRDDRFDLIPLNRFRKCDFIVFSDDGKPLYASSQDIMYGISSDDLQFIADYISSTYYSVYKGVNDTGETLYYVHLNRYDESSDMVQYIASCVLDSSYNIISGSLFSGRTSLTEREFELLNGSYSSNKSIEKCSYYTSGGEKRSLVFISPLITDDTYNKVVNEAYLIWVYSIPLFAAATAIQIFFFVRRIKKSIAPLNSAIANYHEDSDFTVDKSLIPSEFQPTAENFSKLISRLSESQKEKKRMIADISHDLKTPLTVIQGYAGAFIEGRVPDEKAEQYMRTIYQKSVTASEMMNTLFGYVKLEHPEYRLKAESTDICELIKEFLAEKYNELERAGDFLDAELPDKEVILNVDRGLFRRLLDNLTGNFLKYTPSGSTLYVKLVTSPRCVTVTVADDGPGIPERISRQIFSPFVTGDSARASGSGSGLGLTIAKKIVELHGGTIKLITPPHSPFKTEFEISLPVSAQNTQA